MHATTKMETVSLTKRFNHGQQFRKPTTMSKLANRKNQKNILNLAKESTSPDLAPSSSKPSQQQHQSDPAKQELHPQKINLSLKDEHNALIARPLTSTIIYGAENMNKTTNILHTILKKAIVSTKPAHKRSLPLVSISNQLEPEPSVASNPSETFGERLNEIKYRYSNTAEANPENKFTGAHIKLKQQIIDHYSSNNSNLNAIPNDTTTNRSNYTSANNTHAAQTPSVYTQQPKLVKSNNKPMLNLKILKNRLSNSNKTLNVGESSSAEFNYVSRIRLSNTSNNSTKQTTKSLTPEHSLMLPRAFKLIRKSASRSRSKYHGFEAAQSSEHEKPKSERSAESPVMTNIAKTKEFALNSYFNNISNRNKLLTATDAQDEPATNDETGSNFNGLYARKSKLQNSSSAGNNANHIIGFNFETLERSNESLKSFSMNKVVPEDAVKKLAPTLNFINGSANVAEAIPSKTHVSKKEVSADIKKKIENEQSKDTKYYDRPDASSRKIKEEKLNVDEIIYLAANKKKVNEWLDRHVLPFVNTDSVENDLEL